MKAQPFSQYLGCLMPRARVDIGVSIPLRKACRMFGNNNKTIQSQLKAGKLPRIAPESHLLTAKSANLGYIWARPLNYDLEVLGRSQSSEVDSAIVVA